MIEITTAFLLVFGSAFCLLGSVGMLRMPDMLTRLQAATKTGTLGVGFIMLAAAVYFQDLGVTVRSVLVIAFLFLTAPIAAHVIARAAYHGPIRLWARTDVDELKEAIERHASDAPPDPSSAAAETDHDHDPKH